MPILTRLAWLAFFVGCIAVGFKLTSAFLDEGSDNSDIEQRSIEQDIRLDRKGLLPGTLGNGWANPEGWGTSMKDKSATIRVSFDGPSSGDVDLILEAKTSGGDGTSPSSISLEFNGANLGTWQLPPGDATKQRHFLIKQDVLNRATDAKLALILDGPPGVKLALRSLKFRDVRTISNFRGSIDSCSAGQILGWAAADGIPSQVNFEVDGRPFKGNTAVHLRSDLPPHGLPADAGFSFTYQAALPPGSQIDVTFYNGRPLSGSPCSVR